jgi:hypothetical protein
MFSWPNALSYGSIFLPKYETACKFVPIAVHSTYYYKYSKDINVNSDSVASFVRLYFSCYSLLAVAVCLIAKNNWHFGVACDLLLPD